MSQIFIDELFQQARELDQLSVPASWTQGRTVYGGLSAAMLLECLLTKVDASKSLRALNVAFSAPTMPDESFSIETELLREGRTIAQWQARLIQNDTVCVQVQAVFGLPLDSSLNLQPFEAPDIPGHEQAMHYPTQNQPGFTQYFDMAQSQGDLPVSGGSSLQLGGWMRFRQAPAQFTLSHLVAMIDVWPPATMMQMSEMKAGSTVNWTLQFPQPMPSISVDAYVGYQAQIEYSASGYGITHARIWSPAGELLALSQQTVILYG